jgi:hypothetical protein
VLLAIAPPRRAESLGGGRPSRGGSSGTGGSARPGKSTSFMAGLNDRWDKRQDERGQH